ncbi:MAG: MerR family transcriptional regulator [Ktedonobacteraceae bacterium]|nr:MerR family transcriptional regulator [Ktedonobacteraceae bacterium]
MFKIGDFSRLSMVSVKALRYYDERRLLRPARVDEETGYRYYSTDQLMRLNRILALKDMGLSLEQIALLLDQEPTPDQIRGMLRLKQIELHQQLIEGQARLTRIEAWLQAFEQEVTMPAYDVILKKVEPIRVAQTRGTAPSMEQIGLTLDSLFDQTLNYIGQHGATITGPAITVYYDSEFREHDINVGACMPFTGSLNDGEQVKVVELPAIETVASVVHHGSFSTLNQAYGAILKWIEANGYRINGFTRELNLEYERGGDQSKFVTEVQFPVEKS